MLTSQQITDLLKSFDRPGVRGRVEALRRAGRTVYRDGSATVGGAQGPTYSQKRLLDDVLAAIPAPELGQPPQPYRHPGADLPARVMQPTGIQDGQNAAPAELNDSDRLWFQTLPVDPEQIPFEDARALLTLHRDINASGNASDKRLINAVAGPVLRHHDLMAAQSELDQAVNAPFVLIPASAVSALTDAVSAEVPALTQAEAVARADQAVQDIGAARLQARADRIAAAQSALDAASS